MKVELRTESGYRTEPMTREVWRFTCPGCGYSHSVDLPRWTFVNQDPDKPHFTPSLLLKLSDGWKYECHSFIGGANGEYPGKIQFLKDCTHGLAGEVVDLPDLGEKE